MPSSGEECQDYVNYIKPPFMSVYRGLVENSTLLASKDKTN